MVGDEILRSEGRQEALSKAYAHAVAAGAGYTTATYDYDRHGIDLLIQAGGDFSPALGLQLKATVNLKSLDHEWFSFQLEARYYEALRRPSQTPKLLVVLDMPRVEEADWISVTVEELIVRRCAYWHSLKGCPERSQSKPTIRIPKQMFLILMGSRF